MAQEIPTEPTAPLELAAGQPVALPATAPDDSAATESSGACEGYSAPFFRGSGGFVVEPADGRSAELTVQSADARDARTVYAGRDGLAVELLASDLCTNGGSPAECQVTFSGIRGGGWYWVNGDRNAAVAPLACSEDLGGGTAPLDPGGVQAAPSTYGTGTLFIHDTQGLMGIVPQLSPTGRAGAPSCERYVAPFFRGRGGFVAKPESGQTAEVTVERGSSVTRQPLSARSDGLAVQLLSDSLCTDSNGQPVECKVSFTGIGEGGWYWVNGDRNAAVAPLVCDGSLSGTPALEPGGVAASRAAFGTGSLFVHDTQRLMGIVPHLPGAAEDDRTVEVRISVFGGGTVEVVGDGQLECPEARLCNGYFPAAGSVTLRPVAPPQYAFDRWQGCDSVSENDCVVALHADRQLSADFLSTQPLTLKSGVVVFDENRLNDIQRYDPRSGLMVLAADAKLDDIGVGAVLVSSVIDPDREFQSHFLRRVRDLKQRAGSPASLRTTPAKLTDLIAEGTLTVRGSLGAESVSSYVLPPELVPIGHAASDLTVRELADGRRAYEVSRRDQWPERATVSSLSPRPGDRGRPVTSVANPIKLEVDAEVVKDKVKVKGSLELKLDPDFLVDFRLGWPPVREGKASLKVTATSVLTVEAEKLSGGPWRHRLEKAEITFNRLLDSLEASAAAGTLGLSKILVDPTVELSVFLKVDLKTGFEPRAELVVEARAGVHWLHEAGFLDINYFKYESGLDFPDIKPVATVETGVFVSLSTLIFDAAGPEIGVEPYMNVQVSGRPEPCGWDYAVKVGARLKASGKVKVPEKVAGIHLLFWLPDWTWKLTYTPVDLAYTTPLGRCPVEGATPPSPPENIRFPAATSDAIVVVWDPPGGSDLVSYDVQRSYDPGLGPDFVEERTVRGIAEARFTDSGLLAGREYCYRLRSSAVSGGESSFGKSPWSAPDCESTRDLDGSGPSAPVGVVAEARSAGQIALRWEEATDDRRVGFYSVLELGVQESWEIGSTEDTKYNVEDLIPGTEYCFGVRAIDESGNVSDYVERACASTLAEAESLSANVRDTAGIPLNSGGHTLARRIDGETRAETLGWPGAPGPGG